MQPKEGSGLMGIKQVRGAMYDPPAEILRHGDSTPTGAQEFRPSPPTIVLEPQPFPLPVHPWPMSCRRTQQPVHWARWTGCAGVLDHPGSIAAAARCLPPGAHRLPPTSLHIRKGTNAAGVGLSRRRGTILLHKGLFKRDGPLCRPVCASSNACSNLEP